MLRYLAVIASILVIVLLVSSFSKHETAEEINAIARKGNKCDSHKQVSLQDPKTGIDYTIIFCDRTCEHGYPHTINEKTMMIPESHPKERLPITVEHEKIHLLQRRYPEIWEAWYKLMWSYKIQKTPPAEMPKELLEKRRFNPDTEDKPFTCWRGRWWSIAVYTSKNPESLADTKIVWWDEKTGQITGEAPPEWSDFFGTQPQDEHPHEMAAQMIANGAGNKNLREKLMTVYEKHFYRSDRE
jgi:hypothetical protein